LEEKETNTQFGREGNEYSIWKRRKRILNLEEKEMNTQFGREGNEYSIWK
jgi:hypothetical protein